MGNHNLVTKSVLDPYTQWGFQGCLGGKGGVLVGCLGGVRKVSEMVFWRKRGSGRDMGGVWWCLGGVWVV